MLVANLYTFVLVASEPMTQSLKEAKQQQFFQVGRLRAPGAVRHAHRADVLVGVVLQHRRPHHRTVPPIANPKVQPAIPKPHTNSVLSPSILHPHSPTCTFTFILIRLHSHSPALSFTYIRLYALHQHSHLPTFVFT